MGVSSCYDDEMLKKLREHLDRKIDDSLERILGRIAEHEIQERRDILNARDKELALEAAWFVQENMPMAHAFRTPLETLTYAVNLAPRGGMALEFGVYRGDSLRVIAGERRLRGVYGFDSFEGLPEDWRGGFEKGAFATSDVPRFPGVPLIEGWFEDTLPTFVQEHGDDVVDFLHVDCDLYSSTATVLKHVGPLLRSGSVIVFDEFFNYPGWRKHEYRAWQEYSGGNLGFSYKAYTYRSEQVVVQID